MDRARERDNSTIGTEGNKEGRERARERGERKRETNTHAHNKTNENERGLYPEQRTPLQH